VERLNEIPQHDLMELQQKHTTIAALLNDKTKDITVIQIP
jgi:hypothetical protein